MGPRVSARIQPDGQRRFKVTLAGGDTAQSLGGVLADVVVVGSAPRGKAIPRSGARAGDDIFVTGKLGGAAAVLHRMMQGDLVPGGQRKLAHQAWGAGGTARSRGNDWQAKSAQRMREAVGKLAGAAQRRSSSSGSRWPLPRGSAGLASPALRPAYAAAPRPIAYPAPPRPAAAYVAAARQGVGEPAPTALSPGLPACELRLEQSKPPGLPRLAVVGASFTAGVGSGQQYVRNQATGT